MAATSIRTTCHSCALKIARVNSSKSWARAGFTAAMRDRVLELQAAVVAPVPAARRSWRPRCGCLACTGARGRDGKLALDEPSKGVPNSAIGMRGL